MPNESGKPILVVIGDGGVGKTSIILRYTENKFEEGYIPTLEDHYTAAAKADGKEVTFDVADTAGQDDFKSLRDQYMQTGDIFMVVYSVCEPKSLKTAETLLDSIYANKQMNSFNFILVGNMCDRTNRMVSLEDAKEVAKKYNGEVIETSAKSNINIEEAFSKLAAMTLKKEEAGGCCEIF